MGNGQHEGMALLIFGVNTLAQSIELAQECTSSIDKIAAWNIQSVPTNFRSAYPGAAGGAEFSGCPSDCRKNVS